MPIGPAQLNKVGAQGSKAFKLAEGFAVGGPAGAAMALLPDSTGKGLASAVGSVSSGDKNPQDAISRKLTTGKPADDLAAGIAALDHPDVPQSIKDAAAPHLFAAQHYGMNGLQPPDGYHLISPITMDGE